MAAREDAITSIVEPVLRAMGLQLWGVEYISQGRHTLLRVFIDKAEGINVEDCAEASRQISSILDVEDPIASEYTLEVSSPGLERQLFTPEQYGKYTGSTLKMRLRENLAGRRNFSGVLKALANDEVVLVCGDDEFTFPFEQIEKANIVADFVVDPE